MKIGLFRERASLIDTVCVGAHASRRPTRVPIAPKYQTPLSSAKLEWLYGTVLGLTVASDSYL